SQDAFNGPLPPRGPIVLTDTIGPGNPPRPFTFPRYDGKITMNMGPDAFADPRNYEVSSRRRHYGETFIHELVHACQIAHTRNISLTGEALSVQLTAAAGDPYLYGAADQDYTELNLEQQAQIVQDWFS